MGWMNAVDGEGKGQSDGWGRRVDRSGGRSSLEEML